MGFWSFFLRIQVLLGLAKFSHGLSRYPWRAVGGRCCRVPEAQRHTTVRPAVYHGCQDVSSRPVAFWWGPSRFSRSDQSLTRFSHSVLKGFLQMKCGRRAALVHVCANSIKRRPPKQDSAGGIKSMMSSFSSSEKLVTTLGASCPPPSRWVFFSLLSLRFRFQFGDRVSSSSSSTLLFIWRWWTVRIIRLLLLLYHMVVVVVQDGGSLYILVA